MLRVSPVKIAALSLWVASLSLLIIGSVHQPAGNAVIRAWSLWIQMCAWGFTAWWIADSVATRNRLRVEELADIMARVAAEGVDGQSRPPRLTRVH